MKKDIKSRFFKSEQQLLDVINFLPDPTFAIDPEGHVVIWNHAIEEMTGIKAYDIIGKGNFEYSIPFYKTRRPILIDLVLSSNEEIEKLYPKMRKIGDTLYGEVLVPGLRDGGAYIWGIAKPLYDNKGEIIGAIESLRDVSEQRRNTAIISSQKDELQAVNDKLTETVSELQEKNREYEETNRQLTDAKQELTEAYKKLSFSEEKFSKAFKSSPTVVSLSTVTDGKYVDVSDSFYDATGYIKEEVIGHTAFELNIWVDTSDRDRILRAIKEKGHVRDLEMRFRSKGGDIRVKLFSADIITIQGMPHLLAFNADITERKIAEETIKQQKTELEKVNSELKTTICQMEKAHAELLNTQEELVKSNELLRFSEEKFSKTVHLGPVIITLSRLSDGVYVEVSEYFLNLTGYSRDEVIGHSSFELNIWADLKDRDNVVNALKKDGVVKELEIHFLAKNGFVFLMSYSAQVITISGIPHLASVAIDITERRKAEEEKKKLEEQFLQSQKMESIGRLAGGVAHDFNNLLTAIIGNVEIAMLRLGKENRISSNLDMIKKASESAADLTKRLLAFSRKQIIEPKLVNLNEMIEHMQKMLVRLIGEDINLYIAMKAAPSTILADPGHIEQIIVNLSINARDAMQGGGNLTIETENILLDDYYCKNHAYAMPGEYVMLSISDNGTGMSDEIKKHLFEPFFTTKPKGKGTGLGLSMVYGAVKQNKGTIEVYSVEGSGTSFKIYFPLIKDINDTGDKDYIEDALIEGRETILLVEDNHMVLDFAVSILEQMGYTILQAANGEDALILAESYDKQIDLLFTDVVLPGINGKILAEKLSVVRPGLKILFASGYTEDFIAHHGVLHEGINFIGKPYSAYALSRKIRSVIDKE